MANRARTAVVLVAGSAVALGGCTSNPQEGTNPIGTTSVSAGGSQLSGVPRSGISATPTGSNEASTPPGPVVALGDADKGKTIPVAVGEQVTLTLAGTDWRYTDPKPASVLTPMSAPVVANGKASISFRAAKPGTAIVTATRGAESYQITIVVQYRVIRLLWRDR